MNAPQEDPKPGEVWRERRTAYRERTVQVAEVTPKFVYTVTLTTDNGEPPKRAQHNRVRFNLWHKSWVRDGAS